MPISVQPSSPQTTGSDRQLHRNNALHAPASDRWLPHRAFASVVTVSPTIDAEPFVALSGPVFVMLRNHRSPQQFRLRADVFSQYSLSGVLLAVMPHALNYPLIPGCRSLAVH